MRTSKNKKNWRTCQLEWLEVMGLTWESFAEEVRLERIRQAGRRAGCSGGESAACAKVCGRRVLSDRTAPGALRHGRTKGSARALGAASTHALHGARASLFSTLFPQSPAHSPRGARERGWGWLSSPNLP